MVYTPSITWPSIVRLFWSWSQPQPSAYVVDGFQRMPAVDVPLLSAMILRSSSFSSRSLE